MWIFVKTIKFIEVVAGCVWFHMQLPTVVVKLGNHDSSLPCG